MNIYFPIVLEHEEDGAVSAFVPGLPVYAAADTQPAAEAAVRDVLRAYLESHPDARPSAQVRVAQVASVIPSPRQPEIRGPRVTVRSVGALLGAMSSKARVIASRENGKLGGRPRKFAAKAHARKRAHSRGK